MTKWPNLSEEELKELATGLENVFADKRVWLTNDGREMPIDEMTTEHIRNCVAMMLLKPGFRAPFMPLMLEELQKRKQLEQT